MHIWVDSPSKKACWPSAQSDYMDRTRSNTCGLMVETSKMIKQSGVTMLLVMRGACCALRVLIAPPQGHELVINCVEHLK